MDTNTRQNATANNVAAAAEAPWAMPKRPADPSQASQAHVLAHAPKARLVRVCYLKGPDGSFVSAWSTTNGGTGVATEIYVGGCADIGGTDIELTNPNDEAVSGTYMVLPEDDGKDASAKA
jgi:hypothetical protein